MEEEKVLTAEDIQQSLDEFNKNVDKTIRDLSIKHNIQGFVECCNIILDKINNGEDIDSIRNFCELTVKKGKRTFNKVIDK